MLLNHPPDHPMSCFLADLGRLRILLVGFLLVLVLVLLLGFLLLGFFLLGRSAAVRCVGTVRFHQLPLLSKQPSAVLIE